MAVATAAGGMNRLDRYIAATVLVGALMGLVVIVSLSFVFEFIDEADDIGRGDYDLGSAMAVVALSMVQRAYEAFPMATLIGALVSLGALAARSELIVMRAVGRSVGQIARAVVVAGIGLAVLAGLLGEFVAPPANQLAQTIRAEAAGGRIGTVGGGLWARDGDYRLRADRVVRADLLAGVRAYEIDGNQLMRIVTAPRARFVNGQWQLRDARVTALGDFPIRVETRERITLGGQLRPATLEVVVQDAQALPARELFRYIEYLQANELRSDQYQLALWVKLATPLATVVMLLLAVPLVFGSQRGTGVGQQVFLGVLIGLAFFLLNRFLGNAGLVYGLPPAASALAPTGLFLLIALVALRRVR
ncbi:LPS export ABC transporter permease LptG [Spiribacter roseus]|uniref:LPS export ABC transporter permease LptG n=1 Tax=Spiribacter roseus TaxID=1855875 RepID=UPI001F308420|nr:LPS export ABC transporter permease LptG [Spiribacter roseus]